MEQLYKSNFSKTLSTTSRIKTTWIIDSGASDYKTDAYYLFSYLHWAENLKVKITDDTLLPIVEKRSIKFSIL